MTYSKVCTPYHPHRPCGCDHACPFRCVVASPFSSAFRLCTALCSGRAIVQYTEILNVCVCAWALKYSNPKGRIGTDFFFVCDGNFPQRAVRNSDFPGAARWTAIARTARALVPPPPIRGASRGNRAWRRRAACCFPSGWVARPVRFVRVCGAPGPLPCGWRPSGGTGGDAGFSPHDSSWVAARNADGEA